MNKMLFFFLTLILFSCERNNEEEIFTEFSGKVYDRETLDSIPGATVVIVKVDPANPGVIIPFESTVTDSLGKYHYTFTADGSYRYYATASYGNYLFDHYDIVQTGRVTTLDISLLKPGYLSVHVKNTSPFDSLDNALIFFSDYYFPQHSFTGMTIDTTIIITNYGNQANFLNWTITKNDTTFTYNQ